MQLLTKMTVKQLRVYSLMVSGSYDGNKADLIERILKYQREHLQILIKTGNGLLLNPNLDDLPLCEYSSYHKAMQLY